MFDEFGFAMNPDGAFAPRWRGGPMRLHGGKGGSSAPPPDPALIAAQIKSMGIQDSAISEIMSNSRELAPLQREQLKFGLDSAKTAYGQAQEDRTWMLDRRGGLTTQQDRMTSEADSFNEAGRQDELASQATADVGMAFDQARQQQQRNLERSGVNPSSGKALALGQQGALAEAKAKAGAFTKTREAARLEGYALTDRASNALAGYPAMGMSATGAGAGFGASGLGLANGALAGMNSGLTSAGSMAGSMGQNATSMFGAQSSYKTASDNANQGDSLGSTLGGLGGLAMGVAKVAPMFSDRRLKQDIVYVDTDAATGLNRYEFSYKSAPDRRFVGVMADEVQVFMPEAVVRGLDGYDRVNYSLLGMTMVEV